MASNLGEDDELYLEVKRKKKKAIPFTPRARKLDSLRWDVRNSLCTRNKLFAHVEFIGSNSPSRYCYYQAGDKQSSAIYHSVEIVDLDYLKLNLGGEVFPSEELAWCYLSKPGKASLRRILNVPVSLWQELEYNKEKNLWEDIIIEDGDKENDVFTLVTKFGQWKAGVHADILQYLADDLTEEEILPVVNQNLIKVWFSALKSNMGNGEGRTAVYDLFTEIVQLLPHVGVNTPVIVYRGSGSPKDEGWSVSESCNDTSSSPSSAAAAAGRRKMKSESSEGKEKNEIGETDDKSKVWPPRHRHYMDLLVTCHTEGSDFAKYIALVVHSEGKSDEEAERKFLTEIISSLQSQNSVYAFFFSATCVKFYFAERNINKKITIRKLTHELCLNWVSDSRPFNVAQFQLLVMEIFECLVTGVKNIET